MRAGAESDQSLIFTIFSHQQHSIK